MNKVFKWIAKQNPYCIYIYIYILWRHEAQSLKPMLGERSVILEALHPSGRSKEGFFCYNHFNLINNTLIKQGKIPINWRISTISKLEQISNNVEYK